MAIKACNSGFVVSPYQLHLLDLEYPMSFNQYTALGLFFFFAVAPCPVLAAPEYDICAAIPVAKMAELTQVTVLTAKPDPGPYSASCTYHGQKSWEIAASLQLFTDSDTARAQKTTEAYAGIVRVDGLGQKAYWNPGVGQLTVIVKPGEWFLVNVLLMKLRGGDNKGAAIDIAKTMIKSLAP